MNETRSGEFASVQIAYMGDIDTSTDFSLSNGMPFNIKNDSGASIKLEVRLAGMPKGEFISTTFDRGWNPEIVMEIKAADVANLKWGY